MRSIIAAAIVAALLTIGVRAAQNASVHGEVLGGRANGEVLIVELVPVGGGRAPVRAFVGPTGEYDFREVPAGTYQIRLVDGHGEVLCREVVNAINGVNQLNLDLRDRMSASPSGGTVSLKRLRHRAPKQAIKFMQKAEECHRKGQNDKAVEWLAKAVEIDPELMEAQNSLACRYLEMKNHAKAIEHYRKALAIDPSQSALYVNLAVALIQDHQGAEAEAAARRAIDLDGRNERARYILGMALYERGAITPEALHLLYESSPRFPAAALTLAQVYSRLGWTILARQQLSGFMEKGPLEQRAQVERWMKALR